VSDPTAPDAAALTPFVREAPGLPAVVGVVRRPRGPARHGLVLTHGAGSNREAPLLVAVANAFAEAGVAVLRCDLPFRQARPHRPPGPGDAALDRAGLRHAVDAFRESLGTSIALGGHSYGGRQATIMAAEQPGLADALLLLSYPLHPPRRPHEPRTAHFPRLSTPAVFVHGSRDPFGSIDEVRSALGLIPAPTRLVESDGAGHDLSARRRGTTSGAATLADVLERACVALFELAGWR
jgi:predicted alpha/beta-hydrolase family hydrolase